MTHFAPTPEEYRAMKSKGEISQETSRKLLEASKRAAEWIDKNHLGIDYAYYLKPAIQAAEEEVGRG